MFSSVGWGEMIVLLAAGLIILGPERLPGAVSWTMKALRQVRDYATGATGQLKEELGPEFDDLRKPLSELNELRGMTPRAVVTKHLLNGDDSLFTSTRDAARIDLGPTPAAPIKPVSSPLPPADGQSQPHASGQSRPTGETGSDGSAVDVSRWDAT